MKTALKSILFFLLAGCLIAVRVFEDVLFYDPLIDYFHGEYQNHPVPEVNQVKYFMSLLLRFTMNSAISLLMIFTVLTKMRYVKFAAVIYLIVFFLSTIAFFLLINHNEPHKLTLFYVRRILIQPLLLFVLLPALYYQNQTEKRKI